MAGRDPHQAVRAFTDPIQEALSCFASCKITADRFDLGATGRLVVNRAEPVVLNGPGRLEVELLIVYEIVRDEDPERGPFKVRTAKWIHHLSRDDGTPLAQYHWHPEMNVDHPHVHVPGIKAHLPTGRVLVEDVLMAATELGAEPYDADKWEAVRALNLERFSRGATWGHRG